MSDTTTQIHPRDRALPSFALSLIGILALNAYQAITLRSGVKLLFAGLAVAIVTLFSTNSLHFDAYRAFLYNTFALKLFPFICFIRTGNLLRNEIRDGTLEYIWTRPVSRSRIVVGEYLSGALLAFSIGAFLAFAIQLTASARGVPNAWEGSFGLYLGLFFAAIAYSGIAIALSAFSGKFVVLGLLYAFVVEIGISQIPTNVNAIAIRRHVEPLFAGGYGLSLDASSAFSGLMGCLVIGALGLTCGIAIFSRKRYSIGSEKES